ncbi:hypothetical protein FGO68_gene16688 [Halteria grandinella]|uniref:Uncharacterized protein n=1 Tax=Halteria grandinella TaxID=5974 RepID=A0A8J8NEP6_HALGN|nr:hypothetical protein FGO68_gene16688 [Halteria grandinella]
MRKSNLTRIPQTITISVRLQPQAIEISTLIKPPRPLHFFKIIMRGVICLAEPHQMRAKYQGKCLPSSSAKPFKKPSNSKV